METELTRRDALKYSLAGAAALGAGQLACRDASAKDYVKPVPGSEKLTAYQHGQMILLRWNNNPLTGYRAHPTQKYPYFYPLAGPVSGLSLSTESSLPYPHHRGLWLACDPLNGGDYWSDKPLDTGHIRSVGLKLGDATPTTAVITDRCEWVRKDAPSPWHDERKFVVTVPGERLWFLDCEFKLTALEDVAIQGAKHSFFAMRAASDISPTYGGVLMNSKGRTGAKGTYRRKAAWCGFHGKRAARPDVVEGMAIMDHPDNPWSPCRWFTRDYGHLSPSPFNWLRKPWRLAKGKSIELKYRVVLHAGNPKEAGLEEIYQQWIAGAAKKPA